MMDANEEALSLREAPMPPQEIKDPLTLVSTIDSQIRELQAMITDLTLERNDVLNYAVKNGIREDANYKLVEKTKAMRFLNIERFKIVFPEKYELICQSQRADIQEQLQHIGEKIALGVVDKMVNKHALVTAQGVIKVQETISYQVVMK
jgi:hypothetical protein